MATTILNIEKTSELEKLDGFLDDQNIVNGLMNLIRDTQFEFDLGLSSRMLNYHEENGFIRFHREGTAGKRRFSLANALGFQFSLYLKGRGLENSEIAKLNNAVNESGSNGFSDWENLVYLGSALLGLNELYIKLSGATNPKANTQYGITLTSQASDTSLNLSKLIRDTFFEGDQIKTLKSKTYAFLPRYIYEIDKVRDGYKLMLVDQDGFKLISQFGVKKIEKYIDQKSILSLKELPSKLYERMYDIIHQDDEGNFYGIEIKQLNINPNVKFRCEMLTTNSKELSGAIESEVRLLQRMRAKLSKEG